MIILENRNVILDFQDKLLRNDATSSTGGNNHSDEAESCGGHRHWLKGGFPQTLLARNDKAATEWMSGFV